ncbi:MAG: hypothetical protein SPI97_09720 [Oscillospiraceae bacterium]|nr:hypothetical protein [Oscillospiraceae bacterium]
MNYSVFLPVIILFLILYFQRKNEQNIKRIIRKRKKRGITDMSDLFNRYIGKDCLVYLSNGSSVIECSVVGVTDNFLTVKTKDGEEMLNIDYLVRIKEHPVNKNGKKKSVVF